MKKITSILVITTILFGGNVLAQQNFWKATSQLSSKSNEQLIARTHLPTKSIKLDLAYDNLVNYLTKTNAKGASKLLKFPDENGKFITYKVTENSNFSYELQEQYADIRSYSGYNIDNPNQKINFSLSPQFGLFGSLTNGDKNILIDTYTKNKSSYIIYDKSNLVNDNSNFKCHVDDHENGLGIDNLNFEKVAKNSSIAAVNDGNLRKFRLAITTTTEYSNYIIQQANVSNGTLAQKKAAILAAVNVSMTRINGVLKNDVGVFLELIPNTDQLFFIDNDTFNSASANQMVDENVIVTNNTIGSANYDIGHLFFKVDNADDSNGLAYTPAVCINSVKAAGVTGTVAPVGDAFDIDFTAHELGHQLGANHTYNNNFNRSSTSAMEPGSGSTIMAYTGINPPNIQQNSDTYYHTRSIDEINIVLNRVTCAQLVPTTNVAPVITSDLKTFYSLPISTAFALETSATDANNDQLTYTWEQMNPQISETSVITGPVNNRLYGNPPLSSNTRGPNFRSFPPKSEGIRYFPRLEKILTNELVFTTNPYLRSPSDYDKNNWEVIPSVGRTMNFSVTIRDNNTNVGHTTRQNVSLNFVAAAGPFRVTSQTINENWIQNNQATINWDVAGTTANGINTQNVKILLSTNAGQSFDKVLAESVPNNGSYTFTVPGGLGNTNTARIMIKAIDNVFLAVNSTNFSIESSLEIEDPKNNQFDIFPNPSNGIINLRLPEFFKKGAIRIVDITGRIVYSNQLNYSATQQINLSSLSNGVYIVSLELDNEHFTKKIIIKK
ncbi:zinc-dependent metalloprotease [Chishuiella changwenlii]|uniref:zinc-dependent metalloprotease n=1 Tax=Chishuiella changwenlii TaxID=1434701 RepID=UPI002FDB321C